MTETQFYTKSFDGTFEKVILRHKWIRKDLVQQAIEMRIKHFVDWKESILLVVGKNEGCVVC